MLLQMSAGHADFNALLSQITAVSSDSKHPAGHSAQLLSIMFLSLLPLPASLESTPNSPSAQLTGCTIFHFLLRLEQGKVLEGLLSDMGFESIQVILSLN